mgnify:CR=1 FL=1
MKVLFKSRRCFKILSAHSYLTKCIFVHAQGGWLYEEDR